MSALSEKLRQLREAKGADLQQVAAATKVGLHYLEALERGDFSALPGDVFARGFVRAYADFLGADSEGLLALFRRDRDGVEADARPTGERTVQEMSRILATAPHGTARRGLALRFTFDRNLGRLALGAGALAAAVVGVAALAMMLLGRRDVDALPRPQASEPLRAFRRATDVPPPSSASDPVASAPAPTISSPASAPASPPQAPPVAPVVEVENKRGNDRAKEEGPQISEHGVGSRVEGSRLADQASVFQEGDAVWFWTRVDGGQRGQIVRHVWLHDDREVHSVELEVGSAQWRTWSRKTMRAGSAGHWSVEARDAYGRVLASDEFDCR